MDAKSASEDVPLLTTLSLHLSVTQTHPTMDSDDENPTENPSENHVGLMDFFEQLEPHLNLGTLTRLKRVNRQCRDQIDALVAWESRVNLLKCKLNSKKPVSPTAWRLKVTRYIKKHKSRCCECGAAGARRYGKRYSVCESCRYQMIGYRTLVTRYDIRRSFGFSPYRLIMFARAIEPVHGGCGTSPYLYWACDVNRLYRERYWSA